MIERLGTFWQYRGLIKQLVKKDLKLKYRRSFLGYLWSILNPLMIMGVMAIVFTHMFRFDIDNYPVYLLCGQMLFNFMNLSTTNAMHSITGNASLLKKVYVPKYVFPFSKVTSGMIDVLFSLGALAIVMLCTGMRFSLYNLLSFFPFLELYVFCIGMGMALGALNVFFRDIQYIYSAFITAWMYATPIFYPVDQLSGPLQWIIKHLNPMYFYIAQLRDNICYGRFSGWGIVLEGVVAAVLMLFIGMAIFWKTQDDFILYI